MTNNSYYFLGDFNFSGIDWTTLTAKSAVERQFLDIVNDCGPRQDGSLDGSIYLEDFFFTIDNVYILLSRIPDVSSTGMDSIPPFVLKECAQQLSPLIFEFFLQINKTRQWLFQWKT